MGFWANRWQAAFFFTACAICRVALASQQKALVPHRPAPVLTTRELASRIEKSLVMIVSQDREGNPIAQGSGFFITPTLVATNMHVLKRASQGYVKYLSEGVTYRITNVFAFSLEHDICLLYLDGAKGVPLEKGTDDVAVGDEILVAGNPEGLEATVSKGIISAIRMSSGLLQIDAPISPGSSGGPVVNMRGDLVGVAVSSLVEGQNLNFAVPSRCLTDWATDQSLPVDLVGKLALPYSEYEGLSQHVKSVVETEAEYSLDKATGRPTRGPFLTTSRERFNDDGRLIEKDFFDNGAENGKMLWEYSEHGLMNRQINVGEDGKRTVSEISPGLAIVQQTEAITLDETEKLPAADGIQRVCRYDIWGHCTELTIPQKGVKEVRRYDVRGRQTDELEYRAGKLYSALHSSYENNVRRLGQET